jgi:hypothetical protein
MNEVVGAGNHKTAMSMVRAADALCDARGVQDPTVEAAMTQRSRSPAPTGRNKNDRRKGNTRSKSHPPSSSIFFSFHDPGNGMFKCHNFYGNIAHKCICLLFLVRKLKRPPNLYQFGGNPSTQSCISWKMQASFFLQTS